jgi:TrmH family RNA methyltransferase
LPRVQVVLVRPGTAANVGAVARAIRNTGLDGLALVAPGDWRTLECWRSAWGAHEVLEQARVHDVLADALADCGLAVGFSGKAGDAPIRDVRDVAAELAGLAADEGAALVFGPETSGLTRAELALCGTRATIPSHPAQPSLNLSHAVMVAAYEVFRARRGAPVTGPRRASHAAKERLLALLRDGLGAIEALPEANREGYFEEWRALVQRADLTPKEVRLLEHMARKMIARRAL